MDSSREVGAALPGGALGTHVVVAGQLSTGLLGTANDHVRDPMTMVVTVSRFESQALSFGETIRGMDDAAGEAQARTLLDELQLHLADISHKLEAADQRNHRAHVRGIPRRDPLAGILRRELYEVHRLIDGIHRRYPSTAPYRREEPAGGTANLVDRHHDSRAMVRR